MSSFTRQASEHGGGFGLMSSTSMCITCAIVPAPDIYLYIVTDLPPPRQPKSCNPFITSTYVLRRQRAAFRTVLPPPSTPEPSRGYKIAAYIVYRPGASDSE